MYYRHLLFDRDAIARRCVVNGLSDDWRDVAAAAISFGVFPGPVHAPTLEAQYIIKDIILIAAGMVIASTCTGARIVAKPQTLRSTLTRRVPGVYKETAGLPYVR